MTFVDNFRNLSDQASHRIREAEPHRRRHVRNRLQSARHGGRQNRRAQESQNGKRTRRNSSQLDQRNLAALLPSTRKHRTARGTELIRKILFRQ